MKLSTVTLKLECGGCKRKYLATINACLMGLDPFLYPSCPACDSRVVARDRYGSTIKDVSNGDAIRVRVNPTLLAYEQN